MASYRHIDLDIFSVLDINLALVLAGFSFFSPDAERGFLAIAGNLFSQLSALIGQSAHRGTSRALGRQSLEFEAQIAATVRQNRGLLECIDTMLLSRRVVSPTYL